MKRLVCAALAAATLTAGVAQAQHAPTRRKITETVEIAAPADRVWAILGDLKDGSWMDHVVATQAAGEDAATATRTLTLDSGRTLVEKGRRYDPEHRMRAYYINGNDVRDLPAGDYSATITVMPEGAEHAKVEWKAAFYRGHPNNDPPPELNDENSEKGVRAFVRASLENLKAKAEKHGS